MTTIDIGGGLAPVGDINLDPVHGEGLWRRLAQKVPWPVHTESISAVHASHVLEHVPSGRERIAVMNEAWRVLRPGGTFTIVVPLFPSWQAIADPTHVSYWVKESFDYFCRPIAQADYGIYWWNLEKFAVLEGWEGHAVLEKPVTST